jgi:hypothetical protein
MAFYETLAVKIRVDAPLRSHQSRAPGIRRASDFNKEIHCDID